MADLNPIHDPTQAALWRHDTGGGWRLVSQQREVPDITSVQPRQRWRFIHNGRAIELTVPADAVTSSGRVRDGAYGWSAPVELGQETPAAPALVSVNPYTGTPRDPRDVASDPQGLAIVKAGAPLRAAPHETPADVIHDELGVPPGNESASAVFRSTNLGGEHADRNQQAASPEYRAKLAAEMPASLFGAIARGTVEASMRDGTAGAGAAAGSVTTPQSFDDEVRSRREEFLRDNSEAFEDAEFEARTNPSYYGGEDRGPERAAGLLGDGWAHLGMAVGNGMAWAGFWLAAGAVVFALVWKGL